MKKKYSGFLGEPGYSGARRKRTKCDFSRVPNSIESRFMGLVVANNNDLPGNIKVKNQRVRGVRNHIRLDVVFVFVLLILWLVGYYCIG